jgi:hypothetical protein
MRKDQPNTHILLHGQEAGGITKADIERRARELALIRTGTEDYAESDLEAAARELLGHRSPASMTEDAAAEEALSRDPSEPRVRRGHEVTRDTAEPEENAEPERLAIQGVEEAQHDQMVQARRRERDEDRE